MARDDRYDDRDQYRRRNNRDEGFFDRVRGWFSDRDDDDRETNRDWEYRQRYDRGEYRGERVGLHNPDFSFGQQGWTTSTYDRDYGREYDRDYGQGYGRTYDRDYGRSFNRDYGQGYARDYDRDSNRDMDRDRSQDWERTRQWRRDAGSDRDRNTFGNLYGENYSQAGWNTDYNRGDEYSEGYGRSYNRGRFDQERNEPDRGRRYNRDWEFPRDYNDENDYRQHYGYGQEYDPESARYNYYNRDRPQQRGQRRGSKNRQQYGTAGMRSDFEGSSGQYRSAGMRSDYGSRYDYENRQPYDDERSYGQDYIGYESEGAFYQDLDEPVNYQYWEIWEIPGEYTGMGPQNYRRSNESINEDVCGRLTSHGRVDASHIEIQVEDGEVVLKGTVPNREMKRLAEDAAESVSGVREVRNEIRVQQQEGKSIVSGWDYERDQDREREQNRWQNQERNRQTDQIPTTGAAGQTTAGAGLTSGGATSMSAMEAASGVETKRSQLREGMEVIGKNGKVVGRVKEIRQGDFLVDRDMARDMYIPFDAISSVGAQAMLNVEADEVDDQDWEKPDLIS